MRTRWVSIVWTVRYSDGDQITVMARDRREAIRRASAWRARQQRYASFVIDAQEVAD